MCSILHSANSLPAEPNNNEHWRRVPLICGHNPHQDLCIQWDVCHDMIVTILGAWWIRPRDGEDNVALSTAVVAGSGTMFADGMF
jgi:hypothetical protein